MLGLVDPAPLYKVTIRDVVAEVQATDERDYRRLPLQRDYRIAQDY